MAVTKTTRFQVLKRDGHTCQYCGASAPEVKLTVDHVIPEALGGSDKPDNLVAACRDCNAGKGAANPDSELVQKLSAEAATYALEMTNKAKKISADIEMEQNYLDAFDGEWMALENERGQDLYLPREYRSTIRLWARQGVPYPLIEYAVHVAGEKWDLEPRRAFRYVCGVVYRRLESADISHTLGDQKIKLYTEKEFRKQFVRGMDYEQLFHQYADIVARHIDWGLAADSYKAMSHTLNTTEVIPSG